MRFLLGNKAFAAFVFCLGMAAWQASVHIANRRFLRSAASRIVADAGADDRLAKVVAIRDYLRAHVNAVGFPETGRPFFRHSASETLRLGKGYCGEVARAFICLAREVDVPAQRVYLYGRSQHVVAEAEIAPGELVIVDGTSRPLIPDLETLDEVILRPEYDDYYTVNLRRLRVARFVSRVKLEVGTISYLLEDPNALSSALWLAVAGILGASLVARTAVRRLLLKCGWVPASSGKIAII